MRAWQPVDPFGDSEPDEDDARTPPHTLPMAYLPPNRLTVPLPQVPPHVSTSTRLQQQRRQKQAAAASAGSSNPRQGPNSASVVAPRSAKQVIGKQGIVDHEHQREATLDTPIAWFALNVPRQGSDVAARVVLPPKKDRDGVIPRPPPFYTSRDVYHGATRGFVVPGPPSCRTRTQMATADAGLGSAVDAPTVFGTYLSDDDADGHHGTISRSALRPPQSLRQPRDLPLSTSAMVRLPVEVLQRIFRFLPSVDLDDHVVHVQRLWYFAVSRDRLLIKRRFEFHPQEAQVAHNKIKGSSRNNGSPSEATSSCPSHNDARGILYYLATGHRRPPSHNETDAFSPNAALALHPKISLMMIPSPSSLTPRLNKSQGVGAVARSGSSSNQDLSPISSFRAVPFATPEIPFAWVGVEFLHGLQVDVTAYRFSVSTPVPLAWEFQGCADTPVNWATGNWHVLHAVSSSTNPLSASSADGAGATAPDSSPQHSLLFLLPPHRWGPMKRFRLVQVERNAFWGHSFCVSALELYGSLTKVTGTAATAVGAMFLR